MSRPHIVRADTLDLQDHDEPSAQDHSKAPMPTTDLGGSPIAAHQAAEIRHVMEERHEEEQQLQDAWNSAGNHLHSDGGQTHDAQADETVNEHDLMEQNGAQEEGEIDEEGVENIDDDLLDRISSSPSIDDGTYDQLSPPSQWPERSSSLTPNATPTRGAPLFRSAISTPDSSPFFDAPAHFPLSFPGAGLHDSPASTQLSSSPYADTPTHLPFHNSGLANSDFALTSTDHHLVGEYTDCADEGYYDLNDIPEETGHTDSDDDDDLPTAASTNLGNQFAGSVEDLSGLSGLSYSQMDEVDISDVLLPDDDSLLGDIVDYTPLSPTSSSTSSSSWETDSVGTAVGRIMDKSIEIDDDDDDDSGDISFYADDRFVDSGWGGECLRYAEDIDFEFVYALHTFIATVEGQANATKGDTMVLLDDSNSYWWLVRVVKDSSIGYLPAEHIETPTERLARLNKHRNVDLSQAMLGDNPEKSKNPLKKAIRRRNAKTVQFAAPTYVEASDYDYSTEDEDHLNDSFTNGDLVTDDVQEAQVADDEQKAAADAVATDGSREPTPTPNEVRDASDAVKDIKQPEDQQVVSPQIGDKSEAAPIKSRKGARPDSFLKDEAETRKITLTPNILRDDSSSLRSGDNTRGNSFESLEKTPSPVEKGKEEKKKKEKKQGMLSGLFKSKKKEKKVRTEDESVISEMGSPELTRTSTDNSTSTLDRSSAGSLDSKSGKGAKGKLSKAPPSQLASTTASTNSPAAAATKLQLPPMEFLAELEGSQVAFEAPTGHEENMSFENRRRSRSPPPVVFRNTPHHTLEQRQRADSASKSRLGWPKRAKKSDTRMELDDFDESDMDVSEEIEEVEEMHQDSIDHAPKERLSESPIEIQKDGTFMHGTEAIHIPFMTGDIEESEEDPSEVGTMEEVEDDNTPTMSTPEILDASEAKDNFADTTADKAHHDSDATPTPSNPQSPQLSRDDDAVPSLTRSTPSPISSTHEPKEPHRQSSLSSTASSQPHSALSGSQASEKEKEKQWDDASLRRWLDGDNDIRDMLVVVHDKSGITPVGTDHPLMAGLFGEETRRLDEMGKELDGLLGQWMGRRQRKGNTPVPV